MTASIDIRTREPFDSQRNRRAGYETSTFDPPDPRMSFAWHGSRSGSGSMSAQKHYGLNHWPLIGRRVPSGCGDAFGTADPFAAITCPQCRARLQMKVEAHTQTAASFPAGSQNARFFAGDAAHWAKVLAQ